MAVRKKGKSRYKGKVGNTVRYDLNGQDVERSIGVNNKPASLAQLIAREKMKRCNNLLKPVKNLLEFGFKPGSSERTLNPNNLAMRYNMAHAIEGEYPELRIDYGNAWFARGPIPPVGVKPAVRTENGILFEWEQVADTNLIRSNDRVFLLAYLPEEQDAVYQLGACLRSAGKGVLIVPDFNKAVRLETYLFFVSANHKIASDSVYAGRITG